MTSPGRTPGDDAYWRRTRDAVRYFVLPRDLRRMTARYKGMCAWCRVNKATQWDHRQPLDKGGVHGISNLLPCCASCNPSKGNLLLMAWRTSGRPKVPEHMRIGADNA